MEASEEFVDPFPMVKDNGYLNTRDKFIKVYGNEFGSLVFGKADAPLEISTTGNAYQMIGAKLWVQLNTEMNLPGLIRTEKWGTNGNGYNGWRVVTAWPTTKGYAMAEKEQLPDDGIFGFAQLFDRPRTFDNKFSNTELAYMEAQTGQAVVWSQYVRLQGLSHKMFLAEQMAQEIGDNAAKEMTPLDQIVSDYDEFTNCAAINAKGALASKFYQEKVDRSSAAGWYDAYVDHNSETLRVFTMNLMDDLIQGVRENCGILSTANYLFITGLDTQKRLKQLARPHRVWSSGKFTTNLKSGIREVAGQAFGTELNTYDNIPIAVSQHLQDALQPSGGLTPVFLVHLPDISFWVRLPTVYYERGMTQGDDIFLDQHKVVGLYHTMGNMHAYKFFTHGKLRDIKAV
jgi:hypothetical protein